MRSRTAAAAVVLLSGLVVVVQGCRIWCPPDTRMCWPYRYGGGSICAGYEGCKGPSEPCAGECPPEAPVLSDDGAECLRCDGEDCPRCGPEEVWCRAGRRCQERNRPCGGECPLSRLPVLTENGGRCDGCGDDGKWCREEGRCYRPEEEPCNGTCTAWGNRVDRSYCPATGLCREASAPCGGRCADGQLVYCGRTSRCGWDTYAGPGVECCMGEQDYRRDCQDNVGGENATTDGAVVNDDEGTVVNDDDDEGTVVNDDDDDEGTVVNDDDDEGTVVNDDQNLEDTTAPTTMAATESTLATTDTAATEVNTVHTGTTDEPTNPTHPPTDSNDDTTSPL